MKKIRLVVMAVAVGAIVAGVVQIGAGSAYAAPPPKTCPGSSGCGCSTAFAPVICGKLKCRYTNFCIAQCSGWTIKDCTDIP